MEKRRLMSRIVQVVGLLPGVLTIILYGSFARGDHGPKSDVDLLILVRTPRQARLVNERLAEHEFDRQLQPTVRTLRQLRSTDPGLLRNILREGRLLFLNGPLDIPAAHLLDLKPVVLYTFNLRGLAQPEKARFNRVLYPHRTPAYRYSGLLADLGGVRLSSGCFLLPQGACRKMEHLFRQHGVSFRSRQVWM
jgi:predicted nucleotidyltransferase